MIRYYIRWETPEGEQFSPEFFTEEAALATVRPILKLDDATDISLMMMDTNEGWTVVLTEPEIRNRVAD